MKFRAPAKAHEALVQDRLVDDAEHAPSFFLERDQRSPGRPAGDEGARAVDGIEHPAKGVRAFFGAVFFAQDAVAGAAFADQRAHHRFRFAVGGGHRIERRPALVDDVEPLPEIGPDHRARRIGEAMGEGECCVVKLVHLADTSHIMRQAKKA